jgi:hypothetical protein
LVGLQHLDGAIEAVTVERLAALEQHHELLEQPADALGVVALARDRDLVPPHVDGDGEGGLDDLEELIALAQQVHHEVVAGNQDFELRR